MDKAQNAGIKVYILTATMITENPEHENNKKLAAYNDFLRSLAKEKSCVLVDLNADMQKQIADCKAKYPNAKGNLLTVDGVHMNPIGNMMMASGILRAFGMTDAQIAKAQSAWNKKIYQQGVRLTLQDYRAISEKALQADLSVSDYIRNLVKKDIQK